MKKVAIIGHFAKGCKVFDGQTVKTVMLAGAFEEYTDFDITYVDTHGWKKHPFKLYCEIKTAFKNCDDIIMLPAHNGVKVFAPVLVKLKKKYNKKIYYDVIGGWLSQLLEGKKALSRHLKSFDGIWVETDYMRQTLLDMGFKNIFLVPNFKSITPLGEKELVYERAEPLKLCTFSRITRMKGIQDAAEAVRNVNKKLGKTAFTLDIYGGVDKAEKEWFDEFSRTLNDGVCTYKGLIEAEKSVDVLKNYFALLFPTHYYTEGIPGTIIDCLCAGVPVISARWQSFYDCIDDGKSGIGYEFGNTQELENVLLMAAENPQKLFDMKKYCISMADKYTSRNVIGEIQELLL